MPNTKTILERLLAADVLTEIDERLAAGRHVALAGVWGSADALLAGALSARTERHVLVATRTDDEADELAEDLQLFTDQPVAHLPPWETGEFEEGVGDEVTGERMRFCQRLVSGQAPMLMVAPVLSLLQPVPDISALAAGRLILTPGQEHSVESLTEWLVDAGYEHVDQVDAFGQFAHRGGIVDVLAPGEATAWRIEFFGDEIDSIRTIDLDTQRSVAPAESVEILSYRMGQVWTGATDIFDCLPAETIIVLPEPTDLRTLADDMVRRCNEDRHRDEGDGHRIDLFDAQAVFDKMDRFGVVTMHRFHPKTGEEVIDLEIRSVERLSTNIPQAMDTLAELAATNELWVFCETNAERQRFEQLVSDTSADLAGRIVIALGHVRSGFHWPRRSLVAIGHHEIFHRYNQRRHVRPVRRGRPIESLADLDRTDYVVHVTHGIAKFEGLRMLEQDGRSEEYLTLRFAGNAALHVPASEIHLVQKYIGTRGKRPALSKLGGRLWSKQKQRVSEAVKDLAAEMIRTQAMRNAAPGQAYARSSAIQQQFADEFLYTETEDQLTAMAEIESDMAASQPMDRLLCGDVGFGKTELAMRAAMRAVEAGKQVGVLVPTTVLADQHYRTFTERFADFPVRVEVLSRFRTASEQAAICKAAREGQVDILIGTHRLLSSDVQFANLGLAVIDEEQRFGVEHKEHLKRMRASIDVLTMTATPIPRTLHMALLGLRDISALATPPLDRRAIHTEVVPYEDELIRMAIHRELNRQGQVFFLHNRVMDIQSVADRIRQLAGDARVAVAHGQMTEGRLEKTMLRFVRREIDVLVCTTIIESGLDIPTANTIIINEADRFGLSGLHQLRGRVGRYRHRAFCYLLLPTRRSVSPIAARRLKAIEEFSDLGAGFQIAMRDLEIRGAGNILGREQSGHIATVGYELYCELLEQAVSKLQGRDSARRRRVHVELGIDAFVPKSYIPSDRQRMEWYRRIGRCEDIAQLAQVADDWRDAYGPPPVVAQTLLDIAELRLRAAACGIESIILHGTDLVFAIRDFALAEPVFDGPVGTVRLPDNHTAHWRLPPACLEMPTLMTILLKRLRDATKSL